MLNSGMREALGQTEFNVFQTQAVDACLRFTYTDWLKAKMVQTGEMAVFANKYARLQLNKLVVQLRHYIFCAPNRHPRSTPFQKGFGLFTCLRLLPLGFTRRVHSLFSLIAFISFRLHPSPYFCTHLARPLRLTDLFPAGERRCFLSLQIGIRKMLQHNTIMRAKPPILGASRKGTCVTSYVCNLVTMRILFLLRRNEYVII